MTLHEVTRNSIMRISERKTMQLIQEYKQEQCLWNTLLDDYPNKGKRKKAADKIARILNIPYFEGHHVLFKLKNLRNSYCQELKKIAHAEETGESYKPKVQWFQLMDSFIRPHLQTSRSSVLKEVTQSDEMILESIKTEPDTKEQLDWTAPSHLVIPIETTYTEEYHSEDDNTSNDYQAKKPKLSSNISHPYEEVFELSNESIIPSTSQNNDYFDDFGKYIASLLRTLPAQKALALQPKIVNLIVQEVENKD